MGAKWLILIVTNWVGYRWSDKIFYSSGQHVHYLRSLKKMDTHTRIDLQNLNIKWLYQSKLFEEVQFRNTKSFGKQNISKFVRHGVAFQVEGWRLSTSWPRNYSELASFSSTSFYIFAVVINVLQDFKSLFTRIFHSSVIYFWKRRSKLKITKKFKLKRDNCVQNVRYAMGRQGMFIQTSGHSHELAHARAKLRIGLFCFWLSCWVQKKQSHSHTGMTMKWHGDRSK